MADLPEPGEREADRHPARGRRRLRVHFLLELEFLS
jgi:hypothetical protein